MLARFLRFLQIAGLVLSALVGFTSLAAAQKVAPVLAVDGLGKGIAQLDGPWQFHLGDNLEWALPQTGDDAENVGWEQISPDKTWGARGILLIRATRGTGNTSTLRPRPGPRLILRCSSATSMTPTRSTGTAR